MNIKLYHSLFLGLTTSLLMGCFDSDSDSTSNDSATINTTSSVDTRSNAVVQGNANTSAFLKQCETYSPYTSLAELLNQEYDYKNELSFTNPITGESEKISLHYSLSFIDDVAKINVDYNNSAGITSFNDEMSLLGFTITPENLQLLNLLNLTTNNDIPSDVADACGFINVNSSEDINDLKNLAQLISNTPDDTTATWLDFYMSGINVNEDGLALEFDPQQALIHSVSESFSIQEDLVFFSMTGDSPELINAIEAFDLLSLGASTILSGHDLIDLAAKLLINDTGLAIDLTTAREISEELLIERLLGSFTGKNSESYAELLVQAANLGDLSALQDQLSSIIVGGPTNSNTLIADLIAAIGSTEQGASALANLVASDNESNSGTQELLTENPELLNYVITNPEVFTLVQNSDGSPESIRQILAQVANSEEGAELIVDAISDNALISDTIRDILLQNPNLTAAIISNQTLRDDIQNNPQLLDSLANNPALAAQLNSNDTALSAIAQNPEAFAQYF